MKTDDAYYTDDSRAKAYSNWQKPLQDLLLTILQDGNKRDVDSDLMNAGNHWQALGVMGN